MFGVLVDFIDSQLMFIQCWLISFRLDFVVILLVWCGGMMFSMLVLNLLNLRIVVLLLMLMFLILLLLWYLRVFLYRLVQVLVNRFFLEVMFLLVLRMMILDFGLFFLKQLVIRLVCLYGLGGQWQGVLGMVMVQMLLFFMFISCFFSVMVCGLVFQVCRIFDWVLVLFRLGIWLNMKLMLGESIRWLQFMVLLVFNEMLCFMVLIVVMLF